VGQARSPCRSRQERQQGPSRRWRTGPLPVTLAAARFSAMARSKAQAFGEAPVHRAPRPVEGRRSWGGAPDSARATWPRNREIPEGDDESEIIQFIIIELRRCVQLRVRTRRARRMSYKALYRSEGNTFPVFVRIPDAWWWMQFRDPDRSDKIRTRFFRILPKPDDP